jgi:hypothetical protein
MTRLTTVQDMIRKRYLKEYWRSTMIDQIHDAVDRRMKAKLSDCIIFVLKDRLRKLNESCSGTGSELFIRLLSVQCSTTKLYAYD